MVAEKLQKGLFFIYLKKSFWNFLILIRLPLNKMFPKSEYVKVVNGIKCTYACGCVCLFTYTVTEMLTAIRS